MKSMYNCIVYSLVSVSVCQCLQDMREVPQCRVTSQECFARPREGWRRRAD